MKVKQFKKTPFLKFNIITRKIITSIVLVFFGCLFGSPVVSAKKGMTIYQASIFADKKARQVGDLLTILVIERASASREAKTKTSRTSGRNGKLGALVGLPTRGLGATGNVLPEGISLSSASNFDGLGSTEQSDALDATVSVIVTEALTNGTLVIEGQRQITVNGEQQTLTIKGMVREQDISANNTVMSTSLANAEIAYQGKGMISRQQKPGLLSRLLDWVWIF